MRDKARQELMKRRTKADALVRYVQEEGTQVVRALREAETGEEGTKALNRLRDFGHVVDDIATELWISSPHFDDEEPATPSPSSGRFTVSDENGDLPF